MNSLKKYEMIIYCLIYPILTMSFFMIWIHQSTLPGGDIGMSPFLVGIILLIVFGIEITLVLILRKRITSLRDKLISLIIAFLIYELTMWTLGGFGEFSLLESFKKPFEENIEGAFSFSSIFSLVIILGLILITERINKKTLHNTVHN
jgi:asparagine N-glycosylation enzyme membrane subunit Stt3